VISVSLNDSGSRVASLGRDGKIVVAELVADPGFGISPASFRYKVLPLLTEEMKSARKLHFLSSGNLLLTTAEGQVGELSLANAKATPPPTPTPQKNAPVTATDSDY
jgi:hypothetical protein